MALNVGSFFVFVVMLSILVFVHELGHFLTCKWLGVHVEEFGFGFPPRLAGVTKDAEGKWRAFWGQKAPRFNPQVGPRTIYSLNWIPVGGFVRPEGEDNANEPRGLAAAPKRVRFTILVAGAGFNLIFAFLVFTAGYMVGWPKPLDTGVQIMNVAADTPAAVAGLQADDVVLKADGQIITPTTFISYTHAHVGQPILLTIQRKHETLDIFVTPRTSWPEGQGPMGVTIRQPYIIKNYPLPEALSSAGQEMALQFNQLIHLPGQLLRHEVTPAEVRPVGPKGIYDLTRLQLEASIEDKAPYPLLGLMGIISVALAVTNLLPLPALDGGRIVFVLLEAVRGRRIDPAHEGYVHMAGLIALLILMVLITYQDFINPIFQK
jgi:regulator of sigma E protease